MIEPTPQQIKDARNAAGLTQQAAANLLYVQKLAWARWEAGSRAMHPAFYELFRLKTGLNLDE
ncbi:helix-turn-helix domain-containing protein [Acetobacter cibinongensis]|uniref:HTH cro/C1-type domain-containing protein n=1 Tax=Acetobacter cibinongensis TaxID=146475 RepID=A0A1Z5YRN5_9PROT|nr:helix-turn-helix domain-containing protein [Acetobacter cibinongensis]OUI99541.1 hypothetical protein HK14_14190 [Acetobacter cibinongensis]